MTTPCGASDSSVESPVIKAEDVTRYFDVSAPWLNRVFERRGRQTLKAVDGVSFEVAKGETLALVGESGCGKSTVARCIVGLYPLTRGRIEFDGTDIATLKGRARRERFSRRVHMIFQDPYSSLNPRWRVRHVIAEPIQAYGLLSGRQAIQRRIDELLRFVGLSPTDGDKFPHEFSGGQRQRISIARALAGESSVLVCDEPTSALDVSVQAQILNLMKDLQAEFKLTYLFISHDLAVISHVSDRVGVMYLGQLVEIADAGDLFARPAHPYTRLLIQTVPKLDMSQRDREPMAGEVPSPIEPPSGCYFHPRCPLANARCKREPPAPTPRIGGGMVACHAVAEGRVPKG
ncbi:MAG: ABC transporter ATP-binding protein [Alphaproteobacteria bacterium]|nr:ABC transporter ATP-binding protein [Alphaproteobacteria bacterium]